MLLVCKLMHDFWKSWHLKKRWPPFFFFEIWNLRFWTLNFETFPFGQRYSLSLIISKNSFSIEVTKFWNWCHLSFEYFEKFSSSFFLIIPFLKEKKKNKRTPPFFCTFLSSFFLLPPSLLFISPFHLDFLPHYTISSLINHFPKLLNLLSFISLKIFSDLCVLDHFCHKPIFETHIQTSIFFALLMASPIGLPFSLSMGKSTTHLFNGMMEKGSFKTPRPMFHIPTWILRWACFACFSFVFFFIFYFFYYYFFLLGHLLISCFIASLVLRHCHLVVVCFC